VYEKHPTSAALDNTRLVATPDNMANFWAKYTVRTGRLKDFIVGAGINYVGSLTYVGNNPSVEIGERTTGDLTLGYSFNLWDRRWTADVAVKNVTNKKFYESASSWGFPRRAIFSLTTKL
jgi:outer membrane receptor protein involved in Fe transport